MTKQTGKSLHMDTQITISSVLLCRFTIIEGNKRENSDKQTTGWTFVIFAFALVNAT